MAAVDAARFEAERVVKECPPPVWHSLSTEQVFSVNGMPDDQMLLEHLSRQGLLQVSGHVVYVVGDMEGVGYE